MKMLVLAILAVLSLTACNNDIFGNNPNFGNNPGPAPSPAPAPAAAAINCTVYNQTYDRYDSGGSGSAAFGAGSISSAIQPVSGSLNLSQPTSLAPAVAPATGFVNGYVLNTLGVETPSSINSPNEMIGAELTPATGSAGLNGGGSYVQGTNFEVVCKSKLVIAQAGFYKFQLLTGGALGSVTINGTGVDITATTQYEMDAGSYALVVTGVMTKNVTGSGSLVLSAQFSSLANSTFSNLAPIPASNFSN